MICVDASVAVKWILREALSDQADNLFDDAASAGLPFQAPLLIRYEVTNIVRQRVRRQVMPSDQADAVLGRFLDIPLEIHVSIDLHRQALTFANNLGLPAAYDGHYIALAESLNCDLWTDDQRLLRAIGGKLPFVRWIGDYHGLG